MLRFMNSSMLDNPFVQADVASIANNKSIPWESFHGKKIFITGASGLIGSLLIKVLAYRNNQFKDNIKIAAFVRSADKAAKIFKDLLKSNFLDIVSGDICATIETSFDANYIVHAACSTSSKDFVSKPVETIKTILQGTENVLNYAKQCSSAKVIFLSSLEYYGQPKANDYDISEDYLGYIDPQQVRSSYSEGKRMAECLCKSYLSEYGTSVSTARLAQTFGAGIAPSDNRVFAQFAKSIINNQDIVLKTRGDTTRNYCSLQDAISGILTILAKGENGEAYNIASDNTTISIAEMAQMVCDTFGEGHSKVVFDLSEDASKLGYNPTIKISLNTDKLKKLGWSPKSNLQSMFKGAIGSLKLQQEIYNSK